MNGHVEAGGKIFIFRRVVEHSRNWTARAHEVGKRVIAAVVLSVQQKQSPFDQTEKVHTMLTLVRQVVPYLMIFSPFVLE